MFYINFFGYKIQNIRNLEIISDIRKFVLDNRIFLLFFWNISENWNGNEVDPNPIRKSDFFSSDIRYETLKPERIYVISDRIFCTPLTS